MKTGHIARNCRVRPTASSESLYQETRSAEEKLKRRTSEVVLSAASVEEKKNTSENMWIANWGITCHVSNSLKTHFFSEILYILIPNGLFFVFHTLELKFPDSKIAWEITITGYLHSLNTNSLNDSKENSVLVGGLKLTTISGQALKLNRNSKGIINSFFMISVYLVLRLNTSQ